MTKAGRPFGFDRTPYDDDGGSFSNNNKNKERQQVLI
jgi:hypothetical protein